MRRARVHPGAMSWSWSWSCVVGSALVLGAGCIGGPEPGATDASDESELDAAVVGPAGEAVATVYGRIGGTPVAGIEVIFLEADGTVAAVTATDSLGRARGTIHAGASVTAIYGDVLASGPTLFTVLGVAPGDDLTLGTRATPWPTGGRVEVRFGLHPEADRYQLRSSCGGDEGRTPPLRTRYCDDDPPELVIKAMRGADTLAIIAGQELALVDGGQVDLGGAWQALTPFAATLRGVPGGLRRIDVTRHTSAGGNEGVGRESPPPTLTLNLAVTPATTAEMRTELQRDDGAVQVSMAPIAGSHTSYELDVGGARLPWLGPVEVDVARGRVLVPVDGGGDGGDLFFLRADYTRGGARYHWEIVSGRAGDTRLPMLPPPFDVVNPRAGDLSDNGDAWLIDVHDAVSYDDLRGRAFDEAYRAMDAVTRRQERPLRISRSVIR